MKRTKGDRKKNNARRKIYIRTFTALFAAYLILMTGFSIFLLNQQKINEQIITLLMLL
jgi:hypothetical protein